MASAHAKAEGREGGGCKIRRWRGREFNKTRRWRRKRKENKME